MGQIDEACLIKETRAMRKLVKAHLKQDEREWRNEATALLLKLDGVEDRLDMPSERLRTLLWQVVKLSHRLAAARSRI